MTLITAVSEQIVIADHEIVLSHYSHASQHNVDTCGPEILTIFPICTYLYDALILVDHGKLLPLYALSLWRLRPFFQFVLICTML